MTLPAQWQAFSDSVQPDAAVARRRLEQTVDLARKYTSLTEKQLDDLSSYVAEIGNDPDLMRRWTTARSIFLHTEWDELLETPFPRWFCKDMPEQAFLLTIAISGIPDAEERFREKKLPPEKLYESFDEIRAWTDNCESNFGLTGLSFNSGFAWIVLRLFTGVVLRFGRLEYNRARSFCDILVFRHKCSGELRVLLNASYPVNADGRIAAPGEQAAFRTERPFGIFGPYYGYPVSADGRIHKDIVAADPKEWDCVLRPWDEAIYMHIPALGPLKPEQVRASYAAAKEFYSRSGSDYHPKAIICGSWLFDPVLQDLLPENSNLRQFQNSGFLLPSPPEGIGELWRVFGIRGVRDGVASVEWKTSLQKTLGRYIADGGVIRGGRFLYLF